MNKMINTEGAQNKYSMIEFL